MRLRQWIGLFAATSLVAFALGCPPEDPDPDPEITQYQVELVGENEVPPIATRADGTMNVEFDESDNTLTVDGTFDNLISDLIEIGDSSAHLHVGDEDDVGPVVFDVDVDADADNRSGTFEFSRELRDEEVGAFEDNEYYLNIHTEAYPGGELRGQLDEDAPTYAALAESFGTRLTDDAQPHADEIDTDADGWAWAIMRDDDAMVASGAAENLTSEVTEVTIEHAEPGETGNVVFTLDHEMTNDDTVRFWHRDDFSGDQVEEFTAGDYYINVATEEYEDGELRGQLEDEPADWEALFDDIADPPQDAPVF